MKNEKIPFSGRIERLVSVFGRKKDLEDRLRDLGLSRSTLNRLEQGKQEIKADHLEKIALLEKECGLSATSLDTTIASLLNARLLTLVAKHKTWEAASDFIGMSARDCQKLLKKKTLPPSSVVQKIANETESLWSNEEQIDQTMCLLNDIGEHMEKTGRLLADVRVAIAMIPRVKYDPLKILLEEREKELPASGEEEK